MCAREPSWAGTADVRLQVHGGPGGTAARLDDLELAGHRLDAAAGTMTSVACHLGVIAARSVPSPDLLRSPPTWWTAQRCLARAVAGPSGAAVVAARYAAVSTGALAVVAAYRGADSAADAALHAADAAAGEAVGRVLGEPAIVVAAAGSLIASHVPVPPQLGRSLAVVLADHPGAVEHVVDGAPSGVRGLLEGSPLLALLGAAVTGRPGVPDDVPGLAGWVGSSCRTLPWLREGTSIDVRTGPAVATAAPSGLADLLVGIGTLDPQQGAPPGTVRVISVGRAGGRAFVVQVPGTQVWGGRAGGDPLDLSGNIHTMAGERTAAQRTVTAALAAAGAAPQDPVLLVGHSQGGMVAAQLAADPGFRRSFRVTHVVTAGSPVALAPVPASVSVLSLEHSHDLVPRLDGAANPDRPGWITVSNPVEPVGAPADPAASHELGGYAATAAAVGASTDPGLAAWRDGLAPFLAGDGATATSMLVTGVRRPG